MRSIYVAGASAEACIAEGWMDDLRHRGWTVTSTWTERLKAEKTPDHSLTDGRRFHHADRDFAEIAVADVFWLLLPSSGLHTTGAWVEYGYAVGLRKHGVGFGVAVEKIFVSGASSCLFVNSGHASLYPTHRDAFTAINKLLAP